MNSKELLDKAKRCFKLACEAEALQRQREREDLRFQIPEKQWADAARREREGDGVVPPRPILSISKLDQPMQLILNQARAARLGVNIHPITEDATSETAEILQGLYRRIERDSNADQARLWALDRATKCGRGAYRVTTQYDDDAGDSFDQEISIERILYQESVYFDPSAEKADFSDGEWAFVTAWYPIEKFKREFPKAKLSTAGPVEWEGETVREPAWVKGSLSKDGADAAVLVAEYWYKQHDVEEVEFQGRTRKRDNVTVYCCKMCGNEIVEESQLWPGKWIPLVPVIGRELQPIDAERIWSGMIGPSKDGQRLYNYAASALVERMGMEPKMPFIGYEGQFEGHESEWDTINTRPRPYVQVKATMLGDKPAPLPARAQIDNTGMSLAMMAIQEADNFIQTTTSVFDPSLGKLPQKERSGKAILALQQQSDAGTSHYLASLADISMRYEARVVLDLIPQIYDRPGRVTTIVRGDDDAAEQIMVNAPFTKDQEGNIVPAPMTTTGGWVGSPTSKTYDLTKGKYSVSVTIGKAFQTRLQQGAEDMGEILSSRPELMPIIGDLYFKFRDFPGAKEISERLAKVREMQYPGLGEGDDKFNPQEAQVKMQTLQQQVQALQAQLQQYAMALEVDKAKQEATIAKAQIDSETKLALGKLDYIAKLLTSKTEREEKSMDRTHESVLKHEEMAHEVALAAAGGSSVSYKREGGQEQEEENENEMSNGRSQSSESSDESGFEQATE